MARGDIGADELRQLVLKHKLMDVDGRTELPASNERVHRTQDRKYLKQITLPIYNVNKRS